jgi:hypothetical protein
MDISSKRLLRRVVLVLSGLLVVSAAFASIPMVCLGCADFGYAYTTYNAAAEYDWGFSGSGYIAYYPAVTNVQYTQAWALGCNAYGPIATVFAYDGSHNLIDAGIDYACD